MEEQLRQWVWAHGYSDTFGDVWVFDDHDGHFMPWATRLATLRRWLYWLQAFIKQLFCRHRSGWIFNAAGNLRLPTVEAYKWIHKPLTLETRETLPMTRLNWRCSRCRKFDHRYIPDMSDRAREENFQELLKSARNRK